ncbi:PREDICTED: zinc finger protein 830 [Ceratosolen solmsi marchali]|uniref:Zinc finger protein 830 n=1 Tax=Ceratosolen solmsi marchali TaxID=326594 RepID=A0AAJ6YIU6_9HYME|nr:PREDICTED: zinc finger protein 830 [Ceratosolen solmsi marchali]
MSIKNKISKEELRKAMFEAKKKHSAIKKIESPLARYNELDQLTCVLCKLVVRNEAIWPVHLNSRLHKDNIALAKKTKLESTIPSQSVNSNKRLSTYENPQPQKKIKGILKNVCQQSSTTSTKLPADIFENSMITDNNVGVAVTNLTSSSTEVVNNEEEMVNNENKDNKDASQSILPEGFFDDPVKDAKARNVEYKDPIEEEWERFQKEIKEETAQSAQIIGDDQEEAATERQLDVIEEQLRNWSRVMDLVKQKELVQIAERKQDNNESSSDEEDFDEFLDWRAKKSYRD